MSELLETLSELAKRAGDVTMKYFQNRELLVETKQDESPVTVADRETEQFVRDEVARMFPGDIVVGEEFGTGPGPEGARRWIVDPIDGTKSFIHGVPLYGVMIGVEEEGIMVAGAVYIPPSKDLVVAEVGRGCFWNGNKAETSRTASIDQALLLTTDVKSHAQHGREDAFNRLHEECRLMRTWGDCYGHILVATGRADIMMDPIMNPWDCAALLPILKEAGGTFTDYDGRATVYGNNAFSTNGALFDQVMDRIHGTT